MNYKIHQIIGLNNDQKAAQVFHQEQGDNNIFLSVLQLTSDDAFTKGRQVLSDLSDFYFDAEGTTSQKLNATFEEALQKIPKLESETEVKFDLCLAVITGKVFYLIFQGGVRVYLKRESKVSSLSDVGAPNQLISGFLQENDRILLTTDSFSTFLGNDLNKSLELEGPEWQEEINLRISSSDLNYQGLAGLLIDAEVEVEKEEEEAEVEKAVEERPMIAPLVNIPNVSQSDRDGFVQGYDTPLADRKLKPLAALPGLVSKFIPKFKRKESSPADITLSDTPKKIKFLPKSGRGRLILAILLIAIVLGGAGFKYKSDLDSRKAQEANQFIITAKDEFSSAQNLQTLNPVEAKSKLDSAKASVEKALAIQPKNEEAINLKNQIEQSASSILQQFAASEFPVFLDLNLIKEGFRAEKMSLSGNKLLLLDPNSKSLVTVDTSKKSNQTQAGESQLGDATLSSMNGAFAFVYSDDKGLLRIDTNNQKLTEISKTDDELGRIVDIAGFGSNLYVLDGVENQIWKYVPTSTGYSGKGKYLTSDTTADFSDVIRMQIESSVYALKNDGEMLRFTKGAKDNFSYEGLDKNVNSPKSFFVSSDTESIYLLDSGNSRLLILTKVGGYKGQISGDKFATASDLVVDEENKKVYLLEGNNIYTVDLK